MGSYLRVKVSNSRNVIGSCYRVHTSFRSGHLEGFLHDIESTCKSEGLELAAQHLPNAADLGHDSRRCSDHLSTQYESANLLQEQQLEWLGSRYLPLRASTATSRRFGVKRTVRYSR